MRKGNHLSQQSNMLELAKSSSYTSKMKEYRKSRVSSRRLIQVENLPEIN